MKWKENMKTAIIAQHYNKYKYHAPHNKDVLWAELWEYTNNLVIVYNRTLKLIEFIHEI